MRRKERKPLLDDAFEWYVIDDRWYRRDSGEFKFRPVRSFNEKELKERQQRYADSLRVNPPDNIYEVVIELDTEEKLNFARDLIDSLMPTSSRGYFKADILRSQTEALHDRGIRYWIRRTRTNDSAIRTECPHTRTKTCRIRTETPRIRTSRHHIRTFSPQIPTIAFAVYEFTSCS